MMEGVKTALEIEVGKHKAVEKDIRHYCAKRNEKTSGAWQWPEVGTIDEQWCQNMRDRLAIWGEQKKGFEGNSKVGKARKNSATV